MTQLFYAYSTADARHRDQFEKQLQALKQRGALTGWESRAIAPGGAWRRELSPHVSKADVILLLMSADLLASGYLDGPEVAAALKRQRDGDARMLVVNLRPANIKSSVVAHLPTLPRDGKPVTRWNSPDAAFQAIAAGLVPSAASAATAAAPPLSGAARPAAPPPSVGALVGAAGTAGTAGTAVALRADGEPVLSAIALAPEELGPDYVAVDQPKDRENSAKTSSGGSAGGSASGSASDSSKFVGVSRAGARRVAQLVYRANTPEDALSRLSTAVHAELAKGAKAEPVSLPAEDGIALRRVASSTAPSPHVSTFAAKGRYLVAAKVMGATSDGPIDSADPGALSERIVQRMVSRIPA